MTQHNYLPQNTADNMAPTLSKRAVRAQQAMNPFMEQLLAKLFGDQYSSNNPNGLLNIGVAENSLMADWLLDQYKSLSLSHTDLTYGDSMTASQRLVAALSKLFTNHLHARKEVTGKHMIMGVGVSAVLDQLAAKLCDEDEGIMIAQPYYNGFDNDFSARSLVRPVGVDLGDTDPASPESLEHFEAKISEIQRSRDAPVRAILLCNPHNPLGFCYPKETILAYCRFAEKHNLHLIVDEIYALSLYQNKSLTEQTPFTSILSIDVAKEAQCNPARVHMVYGMSKDFGSNGLRVGVLVSQHNPDLIASFNASGILMKVSSPADALWSAILNDEQLLQKYIAEAQSRAGDALAYTVDWLDSQKIKHGNPVAGHFIWIDLREYLPTHDSKGKKLESEVERELEMCQRLLGDGNVYIAPGSSYHSPKAGFFRLTFTLRREYLKVGLDRVETVLKKIKQEVNAE